MASKNFCNQKVKIKKEMPDSVISISFNTANPFKLCHIKYLRRFREAFRLKLCQINKGFMWTILE